MSGRIFHAPLLTHHDKFTLKRIVQRSGDDAKALYPGAIVSSSPDELLNDREIDLIVVNTPDQTHYDLAKRCLEAGKHIVVEKPITQTVEQAEELIDVAHRCGRVLTVFHNRRWDGDFLTVRSILREQKLGRLVEFESHYDRYRNFIQPGTWKERSDAGAGILYNLGSHMIDQALVLFGMPEAVTAHLRIVRTGGEVEDWYDVRLHYPDVNVLLRGSYLVKELGPRYILHGTNGSFVKVGLDPQEEALKQGKNPHDAGWGTESAECWGVLNVENDGTSRRTKVETIPGNYSAFYDNVFDGITKGIELAVKPEEAAIVIRIIDAARRSSQQRQTIGIARSRS